MNRDEIVKGILDSVPQTSVAEPMESAFAHASDAELRDLRLGLGKLASGAQAIRKDHLAASDLDARLARIRERRSSVVDRLSHRLEGLAADDASDRVAVAAAARAVAAPRSLRDLISEKERLESAIAKMIDDTRQDAIAKVQRLMVVYGLTAADLGAVGSRRPSAKAVPKRESGKAWSGEGSRSKWPEDAVPLESRRKPLNK